jgi:hypothetical protein
MNNHEKGKYYESLSQEDLLKQFADKKPRIIDTKINSIQGLDYAIAFEDNSFLMIIENKSPFGSVQGLQKEKEWTKKKLQQLYEKEPNHELFAVIKECLQKGGKVVFQGIKTLENTDLVSRRIKPQHFISVSDLPFQLDNFKINSFQNNSKPIQTMTTGDRRTQFHLDSLSTLDELEHQLNVLNQELNNNLQVLKNYFGNLAEENRWNDIKHAEYAENYISTIEQNIQVISNVINDESITFIQRYRERAIELGITH